MDRSEANTNNENFFSLENQYGANNYSPLPVVIARAEGVWVWDVEGKKYLDCLSAYSALNQGHRHPRIIKAAQEQLKQLTLTSRAFYNDQLGLFERKLCDFTGMDRVLPMNTGAEAVETGIKMARRWGYQVKGIRPEKGEIIVCNNNFHGRTITIIGFSSSLNSRDGFGPFTPGFILIPFNDSNALEAAITANTIGFLVEPIQGEAGVIVPEKGYLRKIRNICTKHNILLILDEIQTGFGRTGKNFAFQHEGILPDILLLGKAMSGGIMPVSAALASNEIMSVFTPGSHGSTFGGNPLGCRVAIEAINVVVEEKLAEKSANLGRFFINRLKKLEQETNIVKSVRGKGLLIAIEFLESFGECIPVIMDLKNVGILAKDTHGSIIRFAPPLVIDMETLDWAANEIIRIIKKYSN